jgi:hypothetical protein
MSIAAAGWPPTSCPPRPGRPPPSASRYQRARTRGLVRLDLGHPEELDLLRRYGPFTTDTRGWVYGDALPIIETADSFGDLPRFTYRLDPAELERVRAALAEAGLSSSSLFPQRIRITKR